jgi:hypothetical protein
MINLIVLVILAACAAGMYLKGTLVQAVTMVFNALLAGFAALAFHETLAGYVVKYVPGFAAWAPLIGFMLLFVVIFALLQTAAMQIHKEKTDMGLWAERIGRAVCGLLLGYLLAGNLLLAVAMAPLPGTYPYPRFEDRDPNPAQPRKPLLSPDGFVSGLFSAASQGSLSALGQPRSFGMLHAGFVDTLYLNRQKPPQQVPIATKDPALEVVRGGVREAPATLRGEDGQPPSVPGDHKLMIVRAAIRKSTFPDAGKFTLSQWRLICGPKGLTNPLAAKGQVVYPLGYLSSAGVLQRKTLDDLTTIVANEVRGTSKAYDLVFSVPSDLVPVLIGFKRNNLEQLSTAAVADDAALEALPEESRAAPAQARPQGEPNAQTPPAPAPPRGGRRSSRGSGNGSGLSGAAQNASGVVLDQDINPQ